MQLDLLEEVSETTELRKELELLKEQAENTRKGLFARYHDLSKLFLQQKTELEHLKEEMKKHGLASV